MNEPPPIRVMLVDDHDIVRRGLCVFLDAFADLELAGEAGSGEEALQRIPALRPDVILLDLVMPGMGGVEAARAIHEKHPAVRIIALTSYQDDDLVRQALKAGVISYLQKNVSIHELGAAIRRAAAGQPTLSPEAKQALSARPAHPFPPGRDLTERELAVLEKMADGLSNLEIAAALHVSSSTVKTHVSNILAKLNAGSRTEAVAVALQDGLVRRGPAGSPRL